MLAMPGPGSAEQANAEISPEKIAQMKRGATDGFQIKVAEVTRKGSATVKKNVRIKAKIVAVAGSRRPSKRGEWIEIDSCELARPDNLAEREREILELADAIIGPPHRSFRPDGRALSS